MIATLKDFILRVETLDEVGDAYYVFEEECTEEVRSLIYGFSEPDEPEPFRYAMRLMGYTDF